MLVKVLYSHVDYVESDVQDFLDARKTIKIFSISQATYSHGNLEDGVSTTVVTTIIYVEE